MDLGRNGLTSYGDLKNQYTRLLSGQNEFDHTRPSEYGFLRTDCTVFKDKNFLETFVRFVRDRR